MSKVTFFLPPTRVLLRPVYPKIVVAKGKQRRRKPEKKQRAGPST